MSFKSVKEAAHDSHAKPLNECATNRDNPGAVSYLKLEGLNEPLTKDILECSTTEELCDVLPPVWSHSEMANHIETPMHLSFLGVTETVAMVLKTTMTNYNQCSAFHKGDNQLKKSTGCS